MNQNHPTAAEQESNGRREPIAIVGIGCRFPGGSDSPAAFWRMLCDAVDAIGEMPDGRFDANFYYDPTPATPGKVATRQGGFLDRIDQFDAPFFDISPREARTLDPQQRLLLETAWEAIEDAGMTRARLAGSRTGVFVGMWTNEYEDRLFTSTKDIDLYATTGGGRYAASGRLSYIFDLQGPSMTVDTACSSSLVAIHLACQSLWAGETDAALVGAVNLILHPAISIGYSRSRMLSPDGRCKFGDARANGYVRSEGCAVIALKPLAQARADGDSIYALIRATAVNNDGHSSGLLVAPSDQGQISMLRRVYQDAGIRPGQVGYVEAHGTGTPVGDPVELRALGTVLGEGRPDGHPCRVGSVKTNIGHTEAASGLAGLIKAALCLKHRAIPASLHFETPNPAIPWAELPLALQQTLGEWPGDTGTRYAGINSFGVTGTNAHVVLQEAPDVPRLPETTGDDQTSLLAISARTPAALRDLARAYQPLLRAGTHAPAAICADAALRREHFEHRLALVGPRAEVAAALEAFTRDEAHPALSTGQSAEQPPRIAFVFPGQGAQFFGMARPLLAHEPAFRAALERCDAALLPETGWSLLERLQADDSTYLDAIDEVQPILCALQIALAALWQRWSVTPDAVVGHSMGEVAAAHVAGILSLEDAMRIIARRSRLLRSVRGQGAMAVVDLTLADAQQAISGFEERVAIAVSNSPRSTVLSGDPDAIDAVLDRLQAQTIFGKRVKVDVASHSPQMDPLLAPLRAELAEIVPHPAALPLYSTVEPGAIVAEGEGTTGVLTLDADYWAHNLRRPVRFADAVQALAADGHTLFIELSPHPLLLPAIEQTLQQAGREGTALPSLRRSDADRNVLLATLATLYTRGVSIDWRQLFPQSEQRVPLPTYPWQRERFWWEADPALSPSVGHSGHPLLGTAIHSAAEPGSTLWQSTLDVQHLPWLADHQVQGRAVLPATGFAELALTAVDAVLPGPHMLEQMTLHETIDIPIQGGRAVQVNVEPQATGALRVRIYSAPDETGDSQAAWRLSAEGVVRRASAANTVHERPEEIQARCRAELTAETHYRQMADRTLVYGPAFRTLARGWMGEGEALAQLAAPTPLEAAPHKARITLLDGAFQLAVAALPDGTAGETFLPVFMERMQIHHPLSNATGLWSHVIWRKSAEQSFTCDLVLLTADGMLLAEVSGLRLQQISRAQGALDDLFYTVRWEAHPRPAPAAAPDRPGRWLLFLDSPEGEPLAAALAARGERCALVTPGTAYRQLAPDRYTIDPANPDSYRMLWETYRDAAAPLRGVIYGWNLSLKSETPDMAEMIGGASVIELIRSLAAAEGAALPRLWLLTHAAQPAGAEEMPIAATQALTWGIGRVVASEIPGLRCTLIDLGAAHAPAEMAQLAAEIWAGACGLPDPQVALRGSDRFVPRLIRRTPPTTEMERASTQEVESYRIAAESPGALDTLRPRHAPRRAPGHGEVEVRVQATGINFLDVLKALGIYPGLEPSPESALGGECAGTVVAIGPGVAGLHPGDEVVVVTPSYARVSCLSSYVTVPEHFALPRPTALTPEEAAGMPVVFMTAWYALHELGRMRRGEWALIHAAAGGVGLAAVQLCRRAGVTIIATAGSPEKRAYLHTLGIEHVLDSRTLDFADQVLAITGGRGVDLVLNSLAGDAIARGMACLAPRGRFLEIGKRDIYANNRIGLEPFKRSLAFFAIDLAGMTDDAPDEVAALFRTVIEQAASGNIQPLPTQAAPATDAEASFRTMAQAQHIGKLVLTFDGRPVSVPKPLIASDATYLITGGLGGLGLALARRLVQQGARHLALIGRSAPSEAARAELAEMEAAGAHARSFAADVAQAESLQHALDTIAQEMPPLRGIFHAAGLLADATVTHLDRAQLHAALAPKLQGGWNLHALTQGAPLDYFVCFSSVAALLGLAGQANYAAGNAFLDALAHQRRRMGLPGLSINWGPWAEVGLAAAEARRGARLAERGLGSLTVQEGLTALEHLLRAGDVQAAVVRLDTTRWLAHDPAAAALLTDLRTTENAASAAAPAKVDLRTVLLATDAGRRRRTLLEDAVRRQLAHVLRIAPDRIERTRPLKALGLDSLMALELRNRLEAETGLTLSATLAFNYPTVALLSDFLAERMQVALEAVELETAPSELDVDPERAEAVGDALSSDEIDALLSDELAAIDRLLNPH